MRTKKRFFIRTSSGGEGWRRAQLFDRDQGTALIPAKER
jgi:hypothetical protein